MRLKKASLRLDRNGLVLITGENRDNSSSNSNGAGKSSIWDALVWALYGKTIRPLDADGFLNKNLGGAIVILIFEDSRGRRWKIKRTRGVKSNPTLDLICNGQNISASSQLQTQKKIEPIIGMDFNSFCTSVIFGQESLRFARLTDKDRKQVLEKLLGLEIYERACNLARQENAGCKLALDMNHASYSKAKDRLEVSRKNLKEARGRIREEKKLSQINIKKVKKNIRKNRLEVESLENDRCEIDNRLNKISKCIETRSAIKVEMTKIHESYEKYNEEIAELQAEISVCKDNKDSTCPTCNQTVKSKSKKAVIRNLSKERDFKSNEMSKSLKRYHELDKESKSSKKLFIRENKLKIIRSEISSEISSLNQKIHSLIADIKIVKHRTNINKDAIKIIKKQIKLDKREMKTYKEDVRKLERKISRIQFWVEGFGHHGIRSYLLDEVIPFLNERANDYSRTLTDGKARITFRTVGETKTGGELDKLTVNARNRDGSPTYEGCSAGERQRVDLCVSLALKDLASSRSKSRIGLSVFDEVFESLDDSGCERVISLLNQDKENLGSCFVITHNDSMKQYFSNRLQVIKEDGISRIEEN